MALSSDLTSQFAKLVTKDKTNSDTKRETTVYGTIVEYEGSKYVRIDGSSFMTPIVTTADVIVGERVTVMIKDHLATVTGNISSPSARTDDVSAIDLANKDLSDRILEIEGVTVDDARIKNLEAEDVYIKNRLTATEADIGTLKTTNVEVQGALTANTADINELRTDKLDADTAKVTYANIDFSNIEKSTMEYFYATSGLIKDVTIGDTTITGKLVGVTISGDLIEGNTVVAEKLVIKGTDGLYYKLNTDGIKVEAQQTDYNSLNGQIIKAKSITATKISVDDLVAFDATIGGFNITEHSIYSGVKESVDNTTRGIYLDNDGQVAFGDESNYLKYYKDANGKYRLDISAESIVFKTGSTAEETFESAMTGIAEEFYVSSSPTELIGGSWSEIQPVWGNNTYIWRRSKVTYGSGFTSYTPSEIGVCITGNTGPIGETGATGDTGKGIVRTEVSYKASSSGTNAPTGDWSATIPTVASGDYLWTRLTITYSDGSLTTTYSVGMMGSTGSAGRGITSTSVMYQTSISGTTIPTGTWSVTIPDVDPGEYIWTRTVITYSDSTKSTSYSIGMFGKEGAKGEKGDGLDVKDTRSDNQPPSWYMSTYPKTTVMEFKNCSTLGLSGVGTYCTLQTIVPWSTSSGGYPKQTAKVEKTGKEYWRVGTSDSAWSAWVDPYGQALEAAKTATNYMAFNDVDAGLVIGDMTAASLKKNVRIDSDSVDIRNGSTVLASFGEDNVTLGRNAEESYIDLCDGAGRISANTAEAATSYPNRNAILIESQEIETESVRFVANVSNKYGASSVPSITRRSELYLTRSGGSAESVARLKSEHKTESSGAYTASGFSAMTYDAADTTRALMYASDSANSKYNQLNIYPTKATLNKPLFINNIEFSGSNKVLWSGKLYMSETQTAILSESISKQANGIILVWSEYTDGDSVNANFNTFFIPKQFVKSFAAKGVGMTLISATFNVVASKYVYISDTSLAGYATNNDGESEKNCGITTTPNKFVLRQVIGV